MLSSLRRAVRPLLRQRRGLSGAAAPALDREGVFFSVEDFPVTGAPANERNTPAALREIATALAAERADDIASRILTLPLETVLDMIVSAARVNADGHRLAQHLLRSALEDLVHVEDAVGIVVDVHVQVVQPEPRQRQAAPGRAPVSRQQPTPRPHTASHTAAFARASGAQPPVYGLQRPNGPPPCVACLSSPSTMISCHSR